MKSPPAHKAHTADNHGPSCRPHTHDRPRRHHHTPRASIAWCIAAMLFVATAGTAAGAPALVSMERVPGGGLQPQIAVDSGGTAHLVSITGDAKAGNIHYRRRASGATDWSEPIRVNSQDGSAIAVGTIRGAQLALGRNGRVHVAWNGSSRAAPKASEGAPMLYARLNDAGTGFEPQRNLMQKGRHLDGGGSVAADPSGRVLVIFHASPSDGTPDESTRAVYVVRSVDDGQTFGPERRALPEETGACACCGLKAWGAPDGSVYVAFRAARKKIHRDMILLTSRDAGSTFVASPLGSWNGTVCPMSSTAVDGDDARVRAAWEIGNRIHLGGVDRRTGQPLPAVEPPGAGKRKHPALATNSRGETLLVWTEGTGWNRGGELAWQLYDRDGRPAGATGRAPGVPAWSFGAAFAEGTGNFFLLY